MGISGLQKYLKERSGDSIAERVDLTEKAISTGVSPILVVDGDGLLYHLLDRSVSWPHGVTSCYNLLIEQAEKFITKAKKAKVELRVFFDGAAHESKFETQLDRSQTRIQDMKAPRSLSDSGNPPPFGKEVLQWVLKKEGVMIGCCVSEADSEIADYTISNGFQAVVGNDTDFIALGANYVKFDDMTFYDDDEQVSRLVLRQYNPKRTAEYFGIPVAWMSLMACLVGNDTTKSGIERSALLQSLDGKMGVQIKAGMYKGVVADVLKFLQKMKETYPDRTEDVNFIPPVLLEGHPKAGELEEMLKTGMGLYHVKFGQTLEQFPAVFQEAHKNASFSSAFVTLLIQRHFYDRIVPLYKDSKLAAPSTLLEPLRKRLYSILFHEDEIVKETLQVRAKMTVQFTKVTPTSENVTWQQLEKKTNEERFEAFLNIFKLEAEGLNGNEVVFCAVLRQLLKIQTSMDPSSRYFDKAQMEVFILLFISNQRDLKLFGDVDPKDEKRWIGTAVDLSSLFQQTLMVVDMLLCATMSRNYVQKLNSSDESQYRDSTFGLPLNAAQFFDGQKYMTIFASYCGFNKEKVPRDEKIGAIFGEEKAEEIQDKLIKLSSIITKEIEDPFKKLEIISKAQKAKKGSTAHSTEKKVAAPKAANMFDLLSGMDE